MRLDLPRWIPIPGTRQRLYAGAARALAIGTRLRQKTRSMELRRDAAVNHHGHARRDLSCTDAPARVGGSSLAGVALHLRSVSGWSEIRTHQ
jgi:hypothetical protein